MMPERSTLRLAILDDCEEPYVEFYVDGENLGAQVKAAFVAVGLGGVVGSDDVLPLHGGDYGIDDTVLGAPARQTGLKDAILFACGCGQFACSGVMTDVEVSDKTLTFRDIATWCRDGRVVAKLGPIVFDRRQFEDAVRQLERDHAAWQAAPPKSPPPPRPPLITPPPPGDGR